MSWSLGSRLAAVALLVLQEEQEAFWCLVAVVEAILPQDYYTSNLVASQVRDKPTLLGGGAPAERVSRCLCGSAGGPAGAEGLGGGEAAPAGGPPDPAQRGRDPGDLPLVPGGLCGEPAWTRAAAAVGRLPVRGLQGVCVVRAGGRRSRRGYNSWAAVGGAVSGGLQAKWAGLT